MATPVDQSSICATPLEQQGLHGMAMPDPYGLKGFKGPVLSGDPDPEDVMEALLMWEVPPEAYPSGIHQTPDLCNYDLVQIATRQETLLHQCVFEEASLCHQASSDLAHQPMLSTQ